MTYDDMMILGWRMRQGYAGFRGFGDAASDYALDHARWVAEKSAYDTAYNNWQATTNQLKTAYALALTHYQLDLARWKAEASAYNTAVVNYQNALRAQQMGYAANQAALAKQGVVIPAGYPGCVTQAQHDAWQSICNQLTSVKGLGALGAAPSGPECLLAQLSVCGSMPPPPPALRAQPQAPASPSYPAPPPGVRPEPQAPPPPIPAPIPPPIATTIPLQTPTPTSTPNTPSVLTPTYQSTIPASTSTVASTRSGGLLSNGLLLIVLAGGGYALYRTFRKPKPTAAA